MRQKLCVLLDTVPIFGRSFGGGFEEPPTDWALELRTALHVEGELLHLDKAAGEIQSGDRDGTDDVERTMGVADVEVQGRC